MSRKSVAVALVAMASALSPLRPATAADMRPVMPVKAAPAPAASAWTYDITPYAWALSLNGSSTIRGHTSDIDMTFIDLLHRKIPKEMFGLMTSFEARNDRFAVIGDFVYTKLGADKSGARQVTLGPLLSAGLDYNLDVGIKMIIAELAGAYEIAHWGADAGVGSGTALDVYGGGRLWWQQAELSLAANATLIATLPRHSFTLLSADRAVAKSGDMTWVDPIVGMRLRHQFSPGHELTLSGDVGGFGAGSQFSWQAVGAYRWTFARSHAVTWSGFLGYRALYVDYSKGSGEHLYAYDMLQHGPMIGVSARF